MLVTYGSFRIVKFIAVIEIELLLKTRQVSSLSLETNVTLLCVVDNVQVAKCFTEFSFYYFTRG